MDITNAIPVLKPYPVRPDNSINLSSGALKTLGWPTGLMCRITVDKANNRICISPVEIEEVN